MAPIHYLFKIEKESEKINNNIIINLIKYKIIKYNNIIYYKKIIICYIIIIKIKEKNANNFLFFYILL